MKYKRQDRLIQEADILSSRTISVDYLVNVFEVTRASILEDLKLLRKKGYNVKKVDWGCYTIDGTLLEPLYISKTHRGRKIVRIEK